MDNQRSGLADDGATICAVALAAAVTADVLHEGVGHAVVALLTGAQSGVLSTVAWSSAFDSRVVVAAGGTIVNLLAGVFFWLILRGAKSASPQMRVFLVTSCAFNLLSGSGYFFLSGVTNFGDWAQVIAGLEPQWAWRAGLTVIGIAAYWASMVLIADGIVRYVGVAREDRKRIRKLTLLPYFTAIVLAVAAGALNPIGARLIVVSALSATAGGHFGMVWLQFMAPRSAVPQRPVAAVSRSYAWIVAGLVTAVAFVAILGPGVTLKR